MPFPSSFVHHVKQVLTSPSHSTYVILFELFIAIKYKDMLPLCMNDKQSKPKPKPKGQPLFKDNATMIALLRDVWSSGHTTPERTDDDSNQDPDGVKFNWRQNGGFRDLRKRK